MKRFVTLLLSTLLIFQFFGIYSVIAVRFAELREEAEERMASGERGEFFAFSKDEFKRLTAGSGEFRRGAETYDIVAVTETGDMVIVEALADDEESALSDLTHSLMKHHRKHRKQFANSLLKLLASHFIPSKLTVPGAGALERLAYEASTFALIETAYDIPTPPPWSPAV